MKNFLVPRSWGAVWIIAGAAYLSAADTGGRPAADPFAEDLPVVEAASLHTQTLDEAPASVTVIGHAEIKAHGYRTFGEALSSVRGFVISNDHIYEYAGVRGFSLPGDFNTRFLVMINGHPMTENVYGSNGFFEQDFGLDIDLVERIEIVRGPSSALYGSNGIFATINVVTIAPVDFAKAYGSVETGSFGQKKAIAAGSFYLGRGANLLLSSSLVNNGGQSFDFPELGPAQSGPARAIGMDGERAYHTFANLTWHNWSVTASFNGRAKQVPLSYYTDANTFFSRGNHVDDGRSFLTAAYTRTAAAGTLRWQLSYDQYRYQDRFDFLTPTPSNDQDLLDRRSYAKGDWITSGLTYQFSAGVLGSLTAGLEGKMDIRNLQFDREISPEPLEFLRINRPERNLGIFLQQEKRFSSKWKLDLGVRIDDSRYYKHSWSPRAALAYQPSAKTVFKLIYGRSYRNPNAYEQFYYDGAAFLQAPQLKPESASTVEFTAEHHFGRNLSASVNVFDYQLRDLIQAVYSDDGASRFENSAAGNSRGAEFELSGKPAPWLETGASISFQRVRLSDTPGLVPNSPARIAKFRAAVPVGTRWMLAANVQGLSSRMTYGEERMQSVALVDLTATLRHAVRDCDLQVGVRNALNWYYEDPVGLSLQEFRGDGRSVYLKLTWNLGR